MDTAELDAFAEEANALAKSRNAQAASKFGLGSHARYDLDLEERRLSFLDAGGARVVTARVVPVGSWARGSHSWLWSWENNSIPHAASDAMAVVRKFGEAHDVAALRQSLESCDESLAWALAAISLKLLDAQCVYRIEQPRTFLFLLLFDLKNVANGPQES
jgi:hypothetical protein